MASETLALFTVPRAVDMKTDPLFGLIPGREGDVRPVRQVWVEADIDENWRAQFALVPYAGQPVVAELRVVPRDEWSGRRPGEARSERLGLDARSVDGRQFREGHRESRFGQIRHGLTAPTLRRVPFAAVRRLAGQFQKKLNAAVAKRGGSLGAMDLFESDDTGTQLAALSYAYAAAGGPAGERRRRGWPDERYARIAREYARRIERGSPHPVADTAKAFKLSEEQTRDAIHTARSRGLLTRAVSRGRAGGMLTPKAEAMLKKGGQS